MKPGDRMSFTLMPDGTVSLRVKTKHVMDLGGSLHKKGRKAVLSARCRLNAGLDTNVLIRFLVRDDEAQFDKARRLIKREAGAGRSVLVSLPYYWKLNGC